MQRAGGSMQRRGRKRKHDLQTGNGVSDGGRLGRPSSRPSSGLPLELLTHIIGHLPLSQRLSLSNVHPEWSQAVQLSVGGVAVDLRAPSRSISFGLLERAAGVQTLALVSTAGCGSGTAAAAASQAGCWDPDEQKLWQQAAGRLRPAAVAWHLRRAVNALTGSRQAPAALRRGRRSLTLLLVAPEMDASASELQQMLQKAEAEGLFGAVSVPQGLVRLDGALERQLVRCNSLASTLPAVLQAPTCYAHLERLALKLSPSDDLEAVLGCINVQTLPALRCLALLASASAGVAANLGALRHAHLQRLDMQGVQLPGGFGSLQQLAGLEWLAVRYDEDDEAPPLNLQGDLATLSALKRLSSLSLDCLAGGDGLPSLTQLTSLSLAPQQGARIPLRGLPLLQRLAVDLSTGSSGQDLLSAVRSTVHVPAQGHGLASLQHLELRCFVWRHWDAAAAGSDAGDGDDGIGSEGGDSEADGDDAASQSSAGSGSSGSDDGDGSEAGSAASWEDEEGDEDDMAGSDAEAEVEAASDDEDVEDVEEEVDGDEFPDPPPAAAVAAGPAGEESEEEEEEQQQAAGLMEATWGFLHQQAGGAGIQQAHAMASLEQRYLSALLARLPSLTSIQLTDYMGLVDPTSLLGAGQQQQQQQQGAKPGLAAAAAAHGGGAAKEAGGAGASGALGGGSSRAGTPGLLLQQQGAAACAAASSLPGWQRAVAETPVPGGISQYDLTYTRAQ